MQRVMQQLGSGWDLPATTKKQHIRGEPEKTEMKQGGAVANLLSPQSKLSEARAENANCAGDKTVKEIKRHWNYKGMPTKRPECRPSGCVSEAAIDHDKGNDGGESKAANLKESKDEPEFDSEDEW
ncbi:hypothetical protein EDC01DRAFT_627752 [Geopyxis carbonaria]|nr:hypothetical protein EDC01DRAFT_627752 [Geopyxis carbonaria]